jgi:uncharacterized glyoxalase superfamily protein PhnB
MLLACSHLVLASGDVPRIARVFGAAFGVVPQFENDMFVEFVLPSAFRIAFFKPVGASAQAFDVAADRSAIALGVTVADVDAVHAAVLAITDPNCRVSGPPKDHPWGERSFLWTDPDSNRWEIAQSPTPDGTIVQRS